MRDGRRRFVGSILAGLCSLLAPLPALAGDGEARDRVAEVVDAARHPWLRRADLRDVRAELRALYPEGSSGLVWFEDGRPAPALEASVKAIGDGAALGLDPADFDAGRLAEAARAAAAGGAPDRDRALLDVALSVEWMRYLSAVHGGRVEAPRAGRGPDLPARRLDLPRLVRETRAGGDPAAVVAAVEPRYPGYARLKAALARQRALAAAPPLPEVPLPAAKVTPGQGWPGIPALRARLRALGDLPAEPSPSANPEQYDPGLVAAVKRFQERHALVEDGVLGKGTVTEVNVPPSRRARQMELALERWRWLPDPGRRVVVVEVPRAELWAIDMARGTTDLRMRTVVGEGRSHATPMLAASISTVVFRPYWVPPPGILKEEILPKARTNPTWLDKHGMEIVARPEEDAETFAPTEDVLSRVARGELTLRQRPGPRNDLGAVKFIVPDAQCIALHGTPYGRLFGMPQRNRSHGCIRLQDPSALARWVLGREPGWDDARIAEAAARERSTTVKLRDPVQVVFVYGTAAVDPDGTEHFIADAYQLDTRVEEELARQSGIARPGSGRPAAR